MKLKYKISTQEIVLPINNNFIIPVDDSVRLLFKIMEELNYTKLYKTYSTLGRNPAINPKNLFKIVVYGYMEGIYSSRKLEKACKRDINFIWLLNGEKAPTHNTIARFKSNRLVHCVEDLFNQLIVKLGEINEIKYENIFIDGTKIEANANRYSFVWKKAIAKFEVKLQEKFKLILNKTIKEFNLDLSIPKNKITVPFIDLVLTKLASLKVKKNIKFVYGKGKRKSKLQKHIEALEEFICKQRKYDNYNSVFNGRNSFSKTDTDATFMRMKEDHMKNGQLKPAYNIQIGVEGEYIVGVDVSSERSDQLTLVPFLKKLKSNLPKKFKAIVADAGYESEENYTYLDTNIQKKYIKPQTYEKMKTRKFKKDISKRENMSYNEEKDFYTCALGRKLIPIYETKKKSKSGFESKVTVYECESCLNCDYKSKCTKAKGNRQLHVSKKFIKQRQESLNNITSQEGKLLRVNRSIQVEGAFGIIKQNYGFRRFLLRKKLNIKTEFLLIALGYNINKLHNKTIQKRKGQLLHLKEII